MKIGLLICIAGLVPSLISCQGDKDSNSPETSAQMPKEEANAIGAPEYLVVKATEDGSTVMASTDLPVVMGTEQEVAAQEALEFANDRQIQVVEGDGSSDEGSSESYYYGSQGKNCYRVTKTYATPSAGYSNTFKRTYWTCKPVYRKGSYRVNYVFVGRAYHKSDRTYYNRYRKSEAIYQPYSQNSYSSRYSYNPNYSYSNGYGDYRQSDDSYQTYSDYTSPSPSYDNSYNSPSGSSYGRTSDYAGDAYDQGYGQYGVKVSRSGNPYYAGTNYSDNYDGQSYDQPSYSSGSGY